MQLIKKRFFKIAVILLLAILTVYIFKINSEVKAELSNPPNIPSNVNQIEYSIDEYPEDLIPASEHNVNKPLSYSDC